MINTYVGFREFKKTAMGWMPSNLLVIRLIRLIVPLQIKKTA